MQSSVFIELRFLFLFAPSAVMSVATYCELLALRLAATHQDD